MKKWKCESGILGGCFCNAESEQRVWVQTLDHMSLINQLSTKKACQIIHHDLINALRLAYVKTIYVISHQFEDMQPFNKQTTGFISRKGDGVNPGKTVDVGNTKVKSKISC